MLYCGYLLGFRLCLIFSCIEITVHVLANLLVSSCSIAFVFIITMVDPRKPCLFVFILLEMRILFV